MCVWESCEVAHLTYRRHYHYYWAINAVIIVICKFIVMEEVSANARITYGWFDQCRTTLQKCCFIRPIASMIRCPGKTMRLCKASKSWGCVSISQRAVTWLIRLTQLPYLVFRPDQNLRVIQKTYMMGTPCSCCRLSWRTPLKLHYTRMVPSGASCTIFKTGTSTLYS